MTPLQPLSPRGVAGPVQPPEHPPLLELDQVEAGYGPYRALFGVSFVVPAGSAVALVGPNGAGKTTVARVVSGLVRPSAGTIRFEGRDVTRWPAWRIARAGLLHAPEGRSVFASLSVEENLVLAFKGVDRRTQAEALERAYSSFERLARRKDQAAGTLSGGEQRMLSLAKVLALPRRLLVVDELSLGLAPAIVDEVFDALRRILAAGTSILVVEQHLERALALAEHVVLLSRGRVLREGPTAELSADAAVLIPPAVGTLGTGRPTPPQPRAESDPPGGERLG